MKTPQITLLAILALMSLAGATVLMGAMAPRAVVVAAAAECDGQVHQDLGEPKKQPCWACHDPVPAPCSRCHHGTTPGPDPGRG
jgi:hypothetical protein